MADSDTIAAIATPIGVGAVSIIRISGPGAISIVDRSFRGAHALTTAGGYTVHHGKLVDRTGAMVDEVLVTLFRSPRSYTGEDMIEVGCHGGMLVTARILQLLVQSGARQAEPGEFTRRAFLNGKIDLSRAEAVAELISARSLKAVRASLDQLEGRLADYVNQLRSGLLDLCSLLELGMDFTEEGIELASREEIVAKATDIQHKLRQLADTYESGRIIRDGVSVVLLGKPNVGKSSLFNALLAADRAIVSPTPGTTRDSIDESIIIEGQLFRLTDTAGIRESTDDVEKEGVERTMKRASGADVAILVVDASTERDVEQPEVPSDARVILTRNKIDLVRNGERTRKINVTIPVVNVSAKTGEGLDDLRREMVLQSGSDKTLEDEGAVVTNLRHRESLSLAAGCIQNAVNAVCSGQNLEIIAFELRAGLHALAAVTGEVTSDDILNSIFGKFCIGK